MAKSRKGKNPNTWLIHSALQGFLKKAESEWLWLILTAQSRREEHDAVDRWYWNISNSSVDQLTDRYIYIYVYILNMKLVVVAIDYIIYCKCISS